jgi:hypothetical protein
MPLPEMMTLLIEFHLTGYHDFKHFYHHAQALYRKEFPQILSYSRLVEPTPLHENYTNLPMQGSRLM